MTGYRLKSVEFRRERESSWRELDGLVNCIEKKAIHHLTAEELTRLPLLYRAALSSLSVARAISLDRSLIEYLESLTSRAYFCVYGAKQSAGDVILTYFRSRFPAALRRLWIHLLLAFLFLLGGTLTGYHLTRENPENFYSFVNPALAGGRSPAASTEELRAPLYQTSGSGQGLFAFASFLFSHNARIGIFAFSLGFMAGIPVFLLVFMNGLMVGAFWALYASRGLGLELWAWMLPHGVTELGAVVVCGAAGLLIGQALVFPGRHPRLVALARAGREAGMVVLGAVAMFFLAALIEGFFRQLVHNPAWRLSFAALTFLLWGFYILGVGRAEEGR